MKITKIGHSCLLIEEAGVRLLTDPGVWNPPVEARDISAVLITHEHPDHCDLAQLKRIIAENQDVRVITHEGVGKILEAEGISCEHIEPGETKDVHGIAVESIGTDHAAIYGGSPCRNTGYRIAGKLFTPGDALHDFPPAGVEVLALPSGGPWMKFSEAIDYAKRLKPKRVFPIHDAMYVEEFRSGLIPRVIGGHLEAADIAFSPLSPGEALEC